jgi:hypothetical protein
MRLLIFIIIPPSFLLFLRQLIFCPLYLQQSLDFLIQSDVIASVSVIFKLKFLFHLQVVEGIRFLAHYNYLLLTITDQLLVLFFLYNYLERLIL